MLDSVSQTVTDHKGYFEFTNVSFGSHLVSVSYVGYNDYTKLVMLDSSNVVLAVKMEANLVHLEHVVVTDYNLLTGLSRMNAVEGAIIFSGKKNEVIVVDGIDANLAANNARQIFEKVPGINIWENDGSGIQLNISTRGLSPNRSWEFNVRQNNYNIQADVLGYPDTYYTPPAEAISRIEVVRGAASLQYGTQLGGLVNFKIKRGSDTKELEMEARVTRGSFNMFNSFTSLGGKKGKLNYFGYYHHRSADGWRQNSDYRWNTGFASLTYEPTAALKMTLEFTSMKYNLHLSAGLTDSMFAIDPQRSVRERNWFEVNWNIPALNIDYKISPRTQLNLNTFMLIASRNSIENTQAVNIPDNMGNRDLRVDKYLNAGTEARLINTYKLFSETESNTLAVGFRFYKGRTGRGQGFGTNGRDANFSFINPGRLEYSDYRFYTTNYSLFAENIFRIGKKLSVIPGFRYEFIEFTADGYYNNAGAIVREDDIVSKRSFPLLGVGMEYEAAKNLNAYANFSQGYRSVNFNDIRITSPTLDVDPNLKDSRGYNFDIGLRGKLKGLTLDVNFFHMAYNDKIGILSLQDQQGNPVLLSTNVSDSKSTGIESFLEFNLLQLLKAESKNGLYLFNSYSYVNALYVRSKYKNVNRNKVEFAPGHILRSGITFKASYFSTTLSVSTVSKQYSDANNTVFSASGNNGVIPAYTVIDWSANIKYKNYRAGFSINNLANRTYFTRRATSYPGPGLIPAEPRNFNFFVGIKL